MRRFVRKLFESAVFRNAPGRGPSKKSARPRLGLEGLEARAMMSISPPTLSGTVLTINEAIGHPGNDTVEIRSAAANNVEVLDNGVSVFNVSGTFTRIDVNLGTGTDTLKITGVPTGLTGRLNVSNVEDVQIGKLVSTGPIQKFSLADVRSEVNVTNPTSLSIRNDGDAADKTVTVTNAAVTGLGASKVSFSFTSSANNRLTLATGNGKDTININSTMPAGQVQVDANGGADTFNVEGNAAKLILNGEAGDDTFNVGTVSKSLGKIDGQVQISGNVPGGSGFDSVVINDQNGSGGNSYTATLTADSLVREQKNILIPFIGTADTASIKFTDVGSVRFDAITPTGKGPIITPPGLGLNATVAVKGTKAATTIFAGAADVVVGDGGKLDGVQGALSVNRTTPGGPLTLDDSKQAVAESYTLNPKSVTRAGIATISFNDNVSTVKLLAGSKNDTVTVAGLRAGTARYDVDAGDGKDTLVAPFQNNVFNLTGAGSGTLDDRVSYGHVENLTGNSIDDQFVFSPGGLLPAGSVAGKVDGAGGSFDTLDYSAIPAGVSVNLGPGQASFTGGVSGIENVFGGKGSDTLTGNSGANVLVGNGGNDTIDGNGGRDLLIGGADLDTLRDTGGEAIYVGGTVKGDLAKPAGLKAVIFEWARTDLTGSAEDQFKQRVGHLKNGGGLNGSVKLNTTTLAADGINDQLDPNGAASAFDLFVIDVNDQFVSASNLPSAVETQQEIVV